MAFESPFFALKSFYGEAPGFGIWQNRANTSHARSAVLPQLFIQRDSFLSLMLVRVIGEIVLTVLLTWDHRKAVLCRQGDTEGRMCSERKDNSQPYSNPLQFLLFCFPS